MDFLNEKFPEKTILFADAVCSNALSATQSFSNLVPSKFAIICDIDQSSVEGLRKLLERFLSLFEFAHVVLLISSPISNYYPKINEILKFDYDIVKILTTVREDDLSDLPQNINRKLIKRIPNLCINITKNFSLVPSFPQTLLGVLMQTAPDVDTIAYDLLDFFEQNKNDKLGINVKSMKCFAFGDYSEKLMNIIESNRNGDPSSALLLVDRNSCCAPLYTHNGSLLDKAASYNLAAVLQDKELIKLEVRGELNGQIGKWVKIDQKSAPNFKNLSKQWQKLSDQEKFNISKEYPSLPFIFKEEDATGHWSVDNSIQQSLLNGANFTDIIESRNLSVEQRIWAIGFMNCISPFDASEDITQAFLDCANGDRPIKNEKELQSILANSFSGVNLMPEEQYELKDVHNLPNLLSFLFDENAKLNNEIVTAGTSLFGSLFRPSQTSLKDFKKVAVFILGGMSFFELTEIEKMAKKSNRNIEYHIYSDAICSAIDLIGN